MGRNVEAYRVFSAGDIARELDRHGFRIVSIHKQFVLPIALHKAIGSAGFTRGLEGRPGQRRRAAACRFARHHCSRAVRVLVTGATGFTGGHLARTLAAARLSGSRPRRGSRAQARDLEAAGIEPAIGALDDRAALARAVKDVDIVYHIAAVYRQAGIPKATYRAVNATAVGDLIDAAAGAGVRRVVHCSTVGVHGDIEHPPANEDAPLRPGDIYQVTKVEGERIAREAAARTGLPVTIARPSGHLWPGRSPPAEAVSWRGAAAICRAGLREHLLSSDVHRRPRRGLPAVRRSCRPPPTGPTSWPAARSRRSTS